VKRLLASVLVFAMLSTSTPGALADGLAGITILRPTGSVTPTPAVTPSAAAIAQQAPVSGAPVSGDLTHLTFTATANLWARIEAPAPGSFALGGAAVVQVQTGLGEGAEVRINGQAVPFANIGQRIVDTKQGFTDYTYYGVPLQPGPNQLVVTPLGAGTLRGSSVQETIYGPGLPAAIDVETDGKAIADGTSVVTLRLKVLDQAHHPAMPGSIIKATLDGDVHFLSDSQIAGQPQAQSQSVELVVQTGGTATAHILAGLRAGDVTLTLASGSLTIQRRIFFAPALRAPMVVGLATVGVGSVPGGPDEDPTAADAADSRRGRIALFGTGAIGDDTLATFAYDTADSLTQTTANGATSAEPAQNLPYQIYGDSSVTRDDALSNDHLFLRLDRDRSNFTWGQFLAQTGETTGPDAGDGFNLLVDGAKLELASSATKVMVFNAHNDIAYGRQIFTPLGLSSTGNLLQPNIVVGSDVVSLVVLDRHTGAILQQTTLTENVDYTLDYNTGQLRFINIPLPFDENFNPQEIVVQYEYQGSDAAAETTGARVQVALDPAQKTNVSVGYVNDAYGSGNFSLLSADVGGVLPGGSWSVEHLTSQGALATDQAAQTLGPGTGGAALRAAFDTALGLNKFDASYDSTSDGFDNPFGGLATPGLLDYRAAYSRLLTGGRGALTLSYQHDQNDVPGETNSQSQATLALKQKMSKRFTLTAQVGTITGPAAASATAAASPLPSASPLAKSPAQDTVTQAQLGFDWMVLPSVDLAASHQSDIGSGTSASQPPQTDAELGVNLGTTGRAYVHEMWSSAPVQSFASSTSSLTSQVSGTHSTDFGIQHALSSQTTVSEDYTIAQTGNGNQISSALGVQEKLPVNKYLHGSLSWQHATGIGEGMNGFNVYGFDFTYNNASMRASESYQMRTGTTPGATLVLGATGAISPDFSLFAAVNDSNAAGLATDDSRVGVAFRPSQDDRAATLVQYEAEVSNSTQIGTRTQVLSLDDIVRPTNALEISGRYAYKLDGDAYYPAQTQLFGLRATQRIGSRFDIGSEVQYLDVRNIPGASATAFAAEAGLRLGGGMRLAFGYNFSGAPDPALAAAPTRRGVYVTLTSVIDRLLGWGR